MGPQYLKSPFEMEERNYSEKTAGTIDEDVRRILDDTYRRVMEILPTNRGPMERISRELIRKETLDRGELDQLLPEPIRSGTVVARAFVG